MRKTLTILTILLLAVSAVYADTAVVYFSATGNTERVANVIADELRADLFELLPAEPYSSSDLNWRDEGSRVNEEHNDPSFRPELASSPDLSAYDTIFLGYPLWWGEAPHIVYTFIENSDLSGKTIIPFATSSSSPLGNSAENLEEAAPWSATWLEGMRFRSRANENTVTSWLDDLNL